MKKEHKSATKMVCTISNTLRNPKMNCERDADRGFEIVLAVLIYKSREMLYTKKKKKKKVK